MKKICSASEIDLRLSLIDCGQCFRWIENDGRFGSVIDGAPVWLRENGGDVEAECGDAASVRNYLDLDRDYVALARKAKAFPKVLEAVKACPGLRVLNQPTWDALVTFIVSANNNIVRIRRTSLALAEKFGERFDTPFGPLHAVPSPEKLASLSEADLTPLGTGYRAPYLVKTARAVCDGFDLAALRNMPYEEAHAKLIELHGVGDKVADCVLLFGCGHSSAIPVDTWVEKLLHEWFGMESPNRRTLQKEARTKFGENAGLFQQFLFHYARTQGV